MIETYEKNIEEVFKSATLTDYNEGLTWYGEAREYCESLAYEYNLPVWKVAMIVSALSPRNKWSRNKQDARTLITKGLEGKYATFHTNRDKALKIFHTSFIKEARKELGKGQKTNAFFINIYNPNSNTVCVDSWACRIANYGKDTPTKKGYRDLVKAYQNVAARHGLVPMDLQAICWVAFRKSNPNYKKAA